MAGAGAGAGADGAAAAAEAKDGDAAKDKGDKDDKDGDEEMAKEDGDKDKDKDGAADPLATSFVSHNPARVTNAQQPFVRFRRPGEDGDGGEGGEGGGGGDGARYVPVSARLGRARGVGAGIVVLRDMRPGEEEDLVVFAARGAGGDDEPEPEAPEPFEWTP